MQPRRTLTTTTAPATEPVTLTEAKLWAKVDSDDDDTLITALIVAAREAAENFTRRAFITQTLKLTLDLCKSQYGNYLDDGVYDLPSSILYGELPNAIELPRPPIASITSVTTYDLNNTGTIYSSSNYSLIGTRLVLNRDASWPSSMRPAGAVEIVYSAGYGSASSVPEAIKTAIKMHVQTMYDGRTVCELPASCEQLLRQFKVYGDLR